MCFVLICGLFCALFLIFQLAAHLEDVPHRVLRACVEHLVELFQPPHSTYKAVCVVLSYPYRPHIVRMVSFRRIVRCRRNGRTFPCHRISSTHR